MDQRAPPRPSSSAFYWCWVSSICACSSPTRRSPVAKKITLARAVPTTLLVIRLIPTLFPFYWMLKSALGHAHDVYKPSLGMQNASLDNFVSLLSSTLFLANATNSLKGALAAASVVMSCSALGGYALARMRFNHKTLLAQVLLFPFMLTEILIGF